MSDTLFWISLASALVVFAGISVFKFTHRDSREEAPDLQDPPIGRL
jgi:hypothetical protein